MIMLGVLTTEITDQGRAIPRARVSMVANHEHTSVDSSFANIYGVLVSHAEYRTVLLSATGLLMIDSSTQYTISNLHETAKANEPQRDKPLISCT